jgi:hypothetical protein
LSFSPLLILELSTLKVARFSPRLLEPVLFGPLAAQGEREPSRYLRILAPAFERERGATPGANAARSRNEFWGGTRARASRFSSN